METNKKVCNKLSWDVCMFFALYVIAPSYCAIEFSSKLPLITLSRMMLILIGGMLIFRRRKDLFHLSTMEIQSLNLGLCRDTWLRRGLFLYFALLMVCHLVLLSSNAGEAIKAIFVLLAECYALIWILSLILDTREKIIAALRILVLASSVTAVIVSIGCILGCNPFLALNFVHRDMVLNFEYRLGVLRAAAGFQHPCYYGAFCTIISPINMYFVENSEKNWEKKLFSVCLALNITGIVLSNSRGSFATFGFLVIIAAISALMHQEFKKFMITYIPIGTLAAFFLVIVSIFTPVGIAFLWGIIKSVLKVLLPEVSLDIVVNQSIAESVGTTSAMDIVVNQSIAESVGTTSTISYGLNEGGGYSRLRQLTGIIWTMTQKPLFGFGSNAHMTGLLSYQYVDGFWISLNTFDVGIVAIICQYGLVGLIGYMALFGAILKACLSKVCFGDPLMRFLCFAIVIYLLHLLTISSLDKMLWVLVASIVCLSNVIHKEALQKE